MEKTILLIDDDMEDHELFVSLLKEYDPGLKVISAINGKQGIEIIERKKPNIVFLDINMPGMNGMEVLKNIKSKDSLKDIPVYMYSTSDGFNSKPMAMKLGAVKYFRKPNSPKGFTRVFDDVFGIV
jgi:CheY-like chemotaxis protein